MGATTFNIAAKGNTAREAFQAAQQEALYEEGHGGYSGSIAEKSDFIMVASKPVSLDDAVALDRKLIEARDPRVADKWGPAGCIPLLDGRFYFFGWASC